MWNKTIRTVNSVTELLTAFFFFAMVVFVFIQIVSRAVLGSSFTWTDELSRYLMIWITFLGASFAFQYGAHISIDVLVNKLPKVVSNIVVLFTTLVIASFLFVLFWEGLRFMEISQNQTASALGISMAYVYLIMPVSSILMFLNLMDTTVKNILSQRKTTV